MTRRAFTLFEMLVAIAITVIIAATLAATVGVGFKVKDAAERAVGMTRDMASIGTVMVRDLGCCLPPASAASDPSTATTYYTAGPFTGDSQQLSFFAAGPEPKAALQGDSRYIEYRLTSDNSTTGQALVRSVDTNVLADPGMSVPTEEILIHGVQSLTFRYFDGAVWYDTWYSTDPDKANSLPYAVVVKIELPPATPDGPIRIIERYIPLWCAVPPSQSSTGGITGF